MTQIPLPGFITLPVHGIALYKVIYQTIDPFGKTTLASGLMAIPQNLARPAPLLSYQHETLTRKRSAPSSIVDDLASVIMAASGYVVATPDYLGLGDSEGLHPYVHAKSLASAAIDMVRAVRTYSAETNVLLNGQLFLAGYSEGGFATMAVHKEMETNHADEFIVTASVPSAGSYDLSGTMLRLALAPEPVTNPSFFPYALLAYNDVYGFAESDGELLAMEFSASIPPLFNGELTAGEIDGLLPSVPRLMFAPDLLEAIEGPDFAPLRTALHENDVYRWTPKAPMRMYHCNGDMTVPIENASVALSYFTSHGADNVALIRLNFGDHVLCALPALLQAKAWIDSLVK